MQLSILTLAASTLLSPNLSVDERMLSGNTAKLCQKYGKNRDSVALVTTDHIPWYDGMLNTRKAVNIRPVYNGERDCDRHWLHIKTLHET